jgi:hypothetical protein
LEKSRERCGTPQGRGKVDRGVGERHEVKESIRKPWIWVMMAVIVLARIPWYLPQGSVRPVFLGLPYWMFIAVFSSL